MVSVTQRIKQIKQPRGGYLPVKAFTVTTLDDGQALNPEESIAASLVGTAVDYLSRFHGWGQLLRRPLRFPCLVLVP